MSIKTDKLFNTCINAFLQSTITMFSYLVVKVCFSSSLWPQAKLAIGHLLSIVPDTSYSHGQYQHSSYNCHGNKGDDSPAGALGDPVHVRETPCISPLGKKRQP